MSLVRLTYTQSANSEHDLQGDEDALINVLDLGEDFEDEVRYYQPGELEELMDEMTAKGMLDSPAGW